MNATATATAAAPTAAPKIEATYAVIPIGSIFTSDTPMQKLRRQHFDKAALQELSVSIKALGVLQPILVRQRKPAQVNATFNYDLVAGERRYLAAKLAGLTTIPATIRELTDLEVIEMQVVENNQREGLHELIEAEGFDQLRKPPHNLRAEDIAAKVGKSRRYVFNRLKLCDLCPEAKAAFYDGKIGGTVAFEIARIAHHDTQRECLRALLHGAGKDEQPTKRYAQELIRKNYMLALDGKAFPIGDATLCPKAGACGPCPKRTGNQTELFDDIKGNGNICTDTKCYADKANAFNQRRRDEAIKAGRTLITGKLAKEMMPYQHSYSISGAVKPDDTCWDDPKHRSYKQVLGKDAPATALLENPHDKTQMIEVWPKAVISQVLKEKLPEKRTVSRNSNGGVSIKKKNEDAEAIEARFNSELLKAIRTKHSGKLGTIELVDIAQVAYGALMDDKEVNEDWKLPNGHDKQMAAIGKMKEAELPKFIIECFVRDGIESGGNKYLTDICKQLKIDQKKLKADAAAAVKKEKAAAAAAKKTPAPAAKKKPAPAKKKAVAKK